MCALATPAATVPTPISATSLTLIRALRVTVLQVVDQLGKVFDRVNVVVRRRADQADPGRRVPDLGDPGPDLVTGELSPLARLGSLAPS